MHRTWKSGNKLVFSLCRYPFLFSTTAKINILHIHAEHEMGIQVNQVRPATNVLRPSLRHSLSHAIRVRPVGRPTRKR
jgi:hypothetical protein